MKPSGKPGATSPLERPLRDPGEASADAVELAREVGLAFTVADVLWRRGYRADERTERFLAPKLASLTPPDAMADRVVAAERLAHAVRHAESIAVYGDYDCDGITSVTILTEVIRELGGEVTPLVANRFAGGYGLSAPGLERVLATGAKLLVTCDCGSADHERLAVARAAGLDAIVVDHHLVPDQELPALAFINPHRPECGFPFKGLATCGLAFSLAAELRKQLGVKLDLRRWLDLVAVGTVADVAPLEGDNRALVRAGLGRLVAGGRIGLDALAITASRGRRLPLSAEDVAYQIAPRINAPGRLGDPAKALQLLLCRDAPEAWQLAEQLDLITRERRQIQQGMEAEAMAQIVAEGRADDPAFVLAQQGWHPGVVGIVAGRIASRYGKPTVVVALEGDSGRGSARAPEWAHVHRTLSACADDLEGLGGHRAAAGLEVRAAVIDRFRERWLAECAAERAALTAEPDPEQHADVRLDPRDDLLGVLGDLERLEPCGERNPAPRLLIDDVGLRAVREVKGHLKLTVDVHGRKLSAFVPEQTEHDFPIVGERMSVVARLKRDHWRGGDAPELVVHTWRRQST